VVRPVDADVVDLVLAVAQLHHTVDDRPRVGGQRGLGRLIRGRSADDRPRPLTVARRDLANLLGRGRCTFLEGITFAAEVVEDPLLAGCTMTCVAVMVVLLVVPSTRTFSPVVTALAEAGLVCFW
jgi:hypothetical protein